MNKRPLKVLSAWGLMLAACSVMADASNPLTGFYYGTASIDTPASIGNVDLAFYLDVTGSSIQRPTSYVDLDKTLLFPVVGQVGGKDVGPKVSGTLSPTNFTLQTDTFTSRVSGKPDPVSRRVVLTGTSVGDGGASLRGTYRETVTGLTSDALVIRGTFRLVKPLPVTADSAVDLNADGCLTLAEIRAGGSDANAIEFSDLSAALNLYNHPRADLRVGNPPGPTCANPEPVLQSALTEYYGDQP